MPRRSQGPRLYLRSDGGRPPIWEIRDGHRRISTGCGAGERAEAETRLAEHLAATRIRRTRAGDPSAVAIADCLTLYITERAPQLARPDIVTSLTPLLLQHAGNAPVSAINRRWCEAYVSKRASGEIAPAPRKGQPVRRPKPASVARDLELLAAALNYAVADGMLASAPTISKPPAHRPRHVWFTRDEIAAMVRACWRERFVTREGVVHYPSRHLARFILFAVYTGTRPGTVTNASFTAAAGRSWIDMSEGTFWRLPEGAGEHRTKLRPPVPIARRLLAHLRRWQNASPGGWLIQYQGERAVDVGNAFGNALRRAGITREISPHALRHTFMTWGLNNGARLTTLAKTAGMSAAIADRVYGHLDPDRREEVDLVAANPHRNRTKTATQAG